MLISTKKAVTISWMAISLVTIVSISLFVPFALLSDNHILPLYIAIPLALVVPIAIMIFSFHQVAIRWLIWAFKNVADVYELEKALYISGFGAYGPDSLEKKHAASFLEIKQRFDSYEFVDDFDVLSETTIYNKAFYQNGLLLFFSSCAIAMTALIVASPVEGGAAGFVISASFAGFAIFQYVQIADRSPQLTISETGVHYSQSSYVWADIQDYKVRPGETSYLELQINGVKEEIVIDYLHISKVKLNHLMHVYQQRHLRAQPPMKH